MITAQYIEREAAEWLARLDVQGLCEARDDIASMEEASPQFAEWMQSSTANRVAFLRQFAAWRRGDRLAALHRGEPIAERQESVIVQSTRWLMPLAASVVLAIGLVTLLPRDASVQFEWETPIGGHQYVPLADGSKVELNTNTRLTGVISDNERRVNLKQGEAFFSVASDKSRPFVVVAGDRQVRVLGTQFTVRHEDGEFEVVVAEGRVQIENSDDNTAATSTVVEKGAYVVAQDDEILITSRSDAEIDASLRWREGLLVFDDVRLDQAAAEFNRYNQSQIIVEGADASCIRIGGSFRVDNVDAFVRLLNDGFGLQVERQDDAIVVRN